MKPSLPSLLSHPLSRPSRYVAHVVLGLFVLLLTFDLIVSAQERSEDVTTTMTTSTTSSPSSDFTDRGRTTGRTLTRINKDYHKLIYSLNDVKTDDATMGIEASGQCLKTHCAYENQKCDGTLFDGTNCTQWSVSH